MTSDMVSARTTDRRVSRLRLIVLRALYALIALGLVLFVWPVLLAKVPAPPHYQGVVLAMLAAFSLLCLLGIRYPLQMLPVLLWELLWKSLWLGLIGVPRWLSGTMDAATAQTLFDCSLVVLVLVAVPWGYVAREYVRKPAERPTAAGAVA
jgi:hypothetical protein